MATTWQAVPGLLVYPTSKLHELCAWLTSLGVQDPKKLVLRSSFLLEGNLNILKGKAAAVFAQMSCKDVAAILHHHPYVLNKAAEITKCRIELVASVLDVPVNSPQVAKFLASSSQYIFGFKTSALEQGIAYFDGLGLPTSGQVKALRIGICGLPDSVSIARTQHFAFKVGWSNEVLARRINSVPGILALTSRRIDANLDSLRVLGFSSEQVTDMAARTSFVDCKLGHKVATG
ncbi:hypothetical protein WJX77_004069 [Trebouxia sp. C0004]